MNLGLYSGVCTGAAGNCRWCQLWGALAFDEPYDPTPSKRRREALSAAQAATELDSAAAATPAMTPHPHAPAGLVAVEVHAFPVAGRRMDEDFMEARRKSVRPPTFDSIRQTEAWARASWADFTESHEIDFSFWTEFKFDSLWSAVYTVAMQPFVASVYPGISADCAWRWALCESHPSMTPHKSRYDRMYVLTTSVGGSCAAMEKLLQQKLLQHIRDKCAFCERYRPGSIDRSASSYFIYLCVKFHRSPVHRCA